MQAGMTQYHGLQHLRGGWEKNLKHLANIGTNIPGCSSNVEVLFFIFAVGLNNKKNEVDVHLCNVKFIQAAAFKAERYTRTLARDF